MRELENNVSPVVPTPKQDAEIYESVESIFTQWWGTRIIDGVAHVHINGEIGCTRPWKELLAEVAGAREIKLYIDSPGGNSVVGINLFHELQQGGKVSETIITGKCFSAALTIALAGKRIKIERRARILAHAPCSWIYGTHEQMTLTASQLEKLTAYLKKIVMERTELSETVVAGWFNGCDVYFSAEQAVAYGLADMIYDEPAPVSAPATGTAPAPIESTGPTLTQDEEFFHDLLRAMPRLIVRNRNEFLRELFAWATYNTDELPKNL